jgi:hypothetical protein
VNFVANFWVGVMALLSCTGESGLRVIQSLAGGYRVEIAALPDFCLPFSGCRVLGVVHKGH